MRWPKAYHPILFAIFPVMSLYARNMALLPFSDTIHPLLMLVGATVLIWAVLGLVLRDFDRAGSAVSILIVFIFGFGPVCNLLEARFPRTGYDELRSTLQPYWIAAAVVLLVAAAWKFRGASHVTKLLNIAGLALAISSLGSVVLGYSVLRRDVARVATQAEDGGRASAVAAKRPPDIYYIILDGCGREDALQQFLGFSIKPFVGELERRGFYVAPKSHSNYSQTEQSLSSSLNMELLPALVGGMSPDVEDRGPFDSLIDRNRVSSFLRSKGYDYLAVTTGFPAVHASSADLNHAGPSHVNLLEATLLANAPISLSSAEAASGFDTRRVDLRSAFDNLRSLGPGGVRPRFVFAHILAPHPPFVFGPNGEPRRPAHGPFGYWDGSDFMHYVGTPQDYIDGYRDQLTYMEKLLVPAIDSILASSRTPPIIIVQGDHGSKLHLDQGSLEKTDVREVFRNFNAYLVPPSVREKLYPTITPVNSFRVVFSGLFGVDLPLRPDHSFYSTFPRPYRYTDVTDQIEDQPKAL